MPVVVDVPFPLCRVALMSITSVSTLIDSLRDLALLEADQLRQIDEVAARHPEPRVLAAELIRCAWLTPYQVNHLFQGRGSDLVLGPFVLLERLGQGGMGTVFKAKNRKLGKVVALKVIRKERLDRPDVVRRFYREVQAAAALEHPNIVHAYDAGEVGETHFLAMEYVEGTDLARLVKQQGPLPVALACDYARQAAIALQHAYERGLVHRDVKPANLLLSAAGGIKVLDFGLARLREAVGEAEASSVLTHEGVVMGTPDFLAPEQSLDSHAVDIRADLYSLGATLFFLLTGRVPFPGGTLGQKIARHLAEAPPALEALRPDVPPTLGSLVRRLMAKRPEDRCQTPAEVATLLAEAHIPTAVPVPPPVPVATPGDTFASMMEVDTADEPAPRPEARRRTPRRARWLWLAGAGVVATALAVLFFCLRPSSAPDAPDAPDKRSPLDRLDASSIPVDERPLDLPDDVVAILGEGRQRHWGAVSGVVLADGEKLVASAGYDKVVRLWDAATMRPVAVLKGHKRLIHALAATRDGRLLASGGDDGLICLWDLSGAEPRMLGKPLVLPKPVWAVALSPDGQLLAAGQSNGQVYLWDLADTEPKQRPPHPAHKMGSTALAFSADGKMLATASYDATVRLLDVSGETIRERDVLPGHEKGARSVAFAPDSTIVATGDSAGNVRLWWQKDRSWVVKATHPQAGGVLSLCFSADGTRLFSTSQETCVIWNASNLTGPRGFRPGHKATVKSLAVTANGRTLISGGTDPTVRRWDLTADPPCEIAPLTGPAGYLTTVAFTPDGRGVIAGGPWKAFHLWDLTGPSPVPRSTGPALTAGVTHAAFSPNGRILARGQGNGVELFDVNGLTFRPRASLKELDQITDIAFSPDSKTLATAGRDGSVRLWALTGSQPIEVAGHLAHCPKSVRSVAFSPDGKRLASGGDDLALRLWDLSQSRPDSVPSLPGHTNSVTPVLFSPDGQTLVSSDHNITIRFWDPTGAEPKPRASLSPPEGLVHALVFTSDSRRFFTAGTAGQILLREVNDPKEEVRRWTLPGEIYALALSPDGRYLATANGNGTVYILRLKGLPRP
jgi:WD40 repeat protein/serine/threonine protein kinase